MEQGAVLGFIFDRAERLVLREGGGGDDARILML